MITHTNDKHLRRRRTETTLRAVAFTSMLVIFVSVFVMILTFALVPSLADSPFVLMILATLSTLTGLQAGKVLATRPDPIEIFERALKGQSADTVLYNYYLPADHVLLTSSAAYVLNPIPHRGKLVFDDGTLHLSSGLFNRFAQGLLLGRPSRVLTESVKQAQALHVWLEQQAEIDIPTYPLAIVMDPDTELELAKQPPIPILLAGKQKPSLKAYLRSQSDDDTAGDQPGYVSAINDALSLSDE